MVSQDFVLKNKMGFHMRPAQDFVKAMSKYSSDINIKFNGKDNNGKSIMNIMA
ncbi:MAG: HPr family phosphocarrier protein, partial [Clostridia bacterium]|nr:HPr family phosphocarrier protein [Clostridia bacterium]